MGDQQPIEAAEVAEDWQEQQLPALRSMHNRHSSFVRFKNVTRYNVGIYWIDYQGKWVGYKVLGCQEYIDINTFVTHPWIFVAEDTKDRFLGNGQYVFFPQAWFEQYRGMAREDLPKRIERKMVNISMPMYTLQELCLRFIKRNLLSYDEDAHKLELPRNLANELANMEPRKPAPKKSA